MDPTDDEYALSPADQDREDLVVWMAQQLVRGYTPPQIRRRLYEAQLDTLLPQGEFTALMREAQTSSNQFRHLAIAKAEMDDTDWNRLDSFARRKRALVRMEAIVESAHGQADTVSKLNQVSFMVGGLVKQQDSMDKLTGATDSKPQVVVNIGYDPLEQMRTVIQKEVVDIEAIEVDTSEEE